MGGKVNLKVQKLHNRLCKLIKKNAVYWVPAGEFAVLDEAVMNQRDNIRWRF